MDYWYNEFMIVSLKGIIEHRSSGFLIIEVGGIGYRVFIPDEAAIALPVSGEVTLYIHEVIRESEREMFGFISLSALHLFWKLIGVSSVGPKVGQKIIYAASIDVVREKIMLGDLAFLTSISGVGTKTAQKIILELKGVLAEDLPAQFVDADALDALVGLGYARKQAEDALRSVGDELSDTEDRIRAALKRLGKM